MNGASLIQSDPFLSGGYNTNMVTLPGEGFDHHLFRVQRYGYGRWCDVPVPILVSQLIRMNHEEGYLDGLRYELIPTPTSSSVADWGEICDTAVSSWKRRETIRFYWWVDIWKSSRVITFTFRAILKLTTRERSGCGWSAWRKIPKWLDKVMSGRGSSMWRCSWILTSFMIVTDG